MSEREDGRKPRKPRQEWDRKPVQRPHSTPKGGKGYDRHREKESFRRELEDLEDQEEQEEAGDLEDRDERDDYEDHDERDDY